MNHLEYINVKLKYLEHINKSACINVKGKHTKDLTQSQ